MSQKKSPLCVTATFKSFKLWPSNSSLQKWDCQHYSLRHVFVCCHVWKEEDAISWCRHSDVVDNCHIRAGLNCVSFREECELKVRHFMLGPNLAHNLPHGGFESPALTQVSMLRCWCSNKRWSVDRNKYKYPSIQLKKEKIPVWESALPLDHKGQEHPACLTACHTVKEPLA